MFEREAWPIDQEDAAEYSTSYGSFVFVKVDVATALWWTQRLPVPFALCFYPRCRGSHTRW